MRCLQQGFRRDAGRGFFVSLLFLDFDGVLHSGNGGGVFLRVHLLWQILRARPEVVVVLSTSWRETYPPDELVDFCTANGGEDLALRFIGQTPRPIREFGRNIPGRVYARHDEIKLWLQDHGHGRPWLALDGDARLFEPDCPNLYLVRGKGGLTDADVVRILERLAP